MTKAVLLSTCGDVFILSLCLKFWKERWYEEVDHVYINFNNHCKVPAEVVGEFMKSWADEPKITFIYHSSGIGNGPPQVESLKICNEDLILLLEDDFFIFDSGVVRSFFKNIENGNFDLIGSLRYGVGEIAEAMKKTYGLDYSGVGDKGYAWWPTGFYCKKSDLLKTDLDFGSKEYPKGKYFTEFNHTMEKTEYTDTFTWASIQLRASGLYCGEIPQNHASPFEIEEYNNKEGKWKEPFGYIHGGSLSAGWGGYLSGQIPDVSTDIAKQEIETRVAFWIICLRETKGFESFKGVYNNGIAQLRLACKLDPDRIHKKVMIYLKLMKL